MGSDDVVEGRVKGMDSMKSKKCMMVLAVVAGLSAGAAFAGAYSEAFSPKVLPRMSGWVRCANPGDWTVSSDYREADGIGQYSVRLTGDTPSHRKLLAHWVAFENEHRTALYRGDFRVQGLSYDAPVLVGEDKSERIVGAYVPGFVADCGAPDRRIILLNGTGGETLTVRFGAPCAGRILDLFGRETGRIDIPQGVSSVRIPRAGRIVVDAAIGSCR